MDKIYINFVVTDFGDDPQVVTALMGIQPTQSWVIGDSLPNHPTARRTHSRWSLASGLGTGNSVEDQLAALLGLLRERHRNVMVTAARFPSEIRCAIYYQDFNPRIHLSPTNVSQAAGLGLAIDFDLYFIGAD